MFPPTGSARRRKGKAAGDKNAKHNKNGKEKSPPSQGSQNNVTKPTEAKTGLQFVVKSLGSVQTDFKEDDKYQKCVCWAPHGMFCVTGGADGHIRAWSVSKVMTFDPGIKVLSLFIPLIDVITHY